MLTFTFPKSDRHLDTKIGELKAEKLQLEDSHNQCHIELANAVLEDDKLAQPDNSQSIKERGEAKIVCRQPASA